MRELSFRRVSELSDTARDYSLGQVYPRTVLVYLPRSNSVQGRYFRRPEFCLLQSFQLLGLWK